MLSVVLELLTFLLVRKKFWLFPVIAALGLLGGIVVLGANSPAMPLIYTLF
jgi:hypothetical protein